MEAFTCRLLIYTPRHPIIRKALEEVTGLVLERFNEHRWQILIHMTGPPPFHNGGVIPILEGNGCAENRMALSGLPQF